MSFLTFEPGGSNPPTPEVAQDIRNALFMKSVIADADFLSKAAADSPVTLTKNAVVLFVDASAGNMVVYLPALLSTELQTVIIKRTDDSTNGVTVYPAAGDAGVQIEGAGSRALTPRSSHVFHSGTAGWWLTGFFRSDLISA